MGIHDLNSIAASCYDWDEFIEDEHDRDLLFDRYGYFGHPFKCPTCNAHFNKLSGLFQHIESSSCDQTLNSNGIGQLRRDLANKLR